MGITQLTDIETRLGKIIRKSFRDPEQMMRWAKKNGAAGAGFWDYYKIKTQRDVHLAPIPSFGVWDCGVPFLQELDGIPSYLEMDDRLATKILVLGEIPCDE